MQPCFIISVAALLTNAAAAARLDTEDAAALCGDLGVVDATNMPTGTNLDKARTCLEHPLWGLDERRDLQKRECWFETKRYGCSGGYCWRVCWPGGEWCWTAEGPGTGPWYKCSSDADCRDTMACSAGDCNACGCGC